jgi:hypothetical protein
MKGLLCRKVKELRHLVTTRCVVYMCDFVHS